MKKVHVLIILIAVMAITLMTVGATSNQKEKSQSETNPILGTWQLSLYKYGSGTSVFQEANPNEGHIKLITDTYFTWVAFNKATQIIYSSAGGTYTLNGDNYTESIEFGLGMDNYLQKKATYTFKIEGDNLFITGNLAENLMIEEVWKRIK